MARKKTSLATEENFIEPVPAQNRQPDLLNPTAVASTGHSGKQALETEINPSSARAPVDAHAVPTAVRERFLQVGEKFFFPTGDPAFRDLGRKLTTRSENAEIVRSLIEIAQARGWSEINVSGTTAFRRSVWQEATLAKLAVKGFTPKEIDEAQLARRMARRNEARDDASPVADGPPKGEVRDVEQRASNGLQRTADATRSGVTYGTLIAHGPENYKLNPNEDMSYFVKLKTDEGRTVTLWGLDLERALKDSKTLPQIGDRIGVGHLGEKTVTVMKREHDAEGRLINERPVQTHRNNWIVEQESFFQTRTQLAEVLRNRSIDARRAVEKHPELAGTYVALKGSELYAERHISDAHGRKRFLDALRKTLAAEVERGDALYAPALRDRPRTVDRAARPAAAPEMTPLR